MVSFVYKTLGDYFHANNGFIPLEKLVMVPGPVRIYNASNKKEYTDYMEYVGAIGNRAIQFLSKKYGYLNDYGDRWGIRYIIE